MWYQVVALRGGHEHCLGKAADLVALKKELATLSKTM